MPLQLTSGWFHRASRVLALACAFVASAVACGPDFPNRYSYFDASDEFLLAGPEGSFVAEVKRLVAGHSSAWRAMPADASRDLALDAEDLATALRERGTSEARILAMVDSWTQLRRDPAATVAAPEDLPAEFVFYLMGARAWRAKEAGAARRAWSALLALPEGERRHRSTWAAYMLGRTHEDQSASSVEDADAARRWYRQTRTLAAAGCADPLGLAAASLGREALVELRQGNRPGAITLYVKQLAAGDETAVGSLRDVASSVDVDDPAELSRVVADPVARQVISAWFVSRVRGVEFGQVNDRYRTQVAAWGAALAAAEVRDESAAVLFAWADYRGGNFAAAKYWLALAPAEAPIVRWLRAKLALRAGRLSEGAALLTDLVHGADALAPTHRQQAFAELGRVRLALDDVPGALAAWVEAGQLVDAAYLGEIVMTTDELRAFVDVHCPDEEYGKRVGDHAAGPVEARCTLRYLLARRLAREGRADEATTYFHWTLRERYAAYVADVRVGFDSGRPARERADAFWRAAQSIQSDGYGLLATAIEPDWAISGYNWGSAADNRVAKTAATESMFAPTGVERERLEKRHRPGPRFTHRYRAADLAWWAASLLPNDSDETARILCEAGWWIAPRDPQGAQRFYQALVIRCGNTPLGRAAAEKRWFPAPAHDESAAPVPPAQ